MEKLRKENHGEKVSYHPYAPEGKVGRGKYGTQTFLNRM
jgi:hypothetical protein